VPPTHPRRLGAYDILAKIAGGGMASVYLGRAIDPRGGERVAAIKVIKPELAHVTEFSQMFLDEARILERLDHPNINGALEYGVSGGRHFIAMELLLGRTLRDVWDAAVEKRRSFPLDLAAWICAGVAHGLHHAHELRDEAGRPLDVIHRDADPSNVFLTYDGRVKLFDFGLAKAKDQLSVTQEGVVKGKISYLSPEQVELVALDRRSDVLTLGVILWEMTTMRRLFKRDSHLDAVLAIREAQVPDPGTLVAAYPGALREIAKRALERDRDARFATAAALAEELERFVGAHQTAEMPARLGRLLDELFVGERARQVGWLQDTAAISESTSRVTMPPPAPVVPRIDEPEDPDA
jgi:eukaryotic-like serine/threonine-protein kinase